MGTWRCVGSGHWPRVSQGWDAVGPGAPRPSPVTGQGGAHAARSRGRWEEQRVRTGGLQPRCSQVPCALTRSLVGFGKPESRERGRQSGSPCGGPRRAGWTGTGGRVFTPRLSRKPSFHDFLGPPDPKEVRPLRRMKALGVRGRARAGIPSTPAPAPAAPQLLQRNPRGPRAPSRDRRINSRLQHGGRGLSRDHQGREVPQGGGRHMGQRRHG